MLKVGKKIIWLVKRHPYLYYTRFKLLSKEASQNEAITHTYNLINKKQHIPKSFHIVNAIILKGKVQMNTFNKVRNDKIMDFIYDKMDISFKKVKPDEFSKIVSN